MNTRLYYLAAKEEEEGGGGGEAGQKGRGIIRGNDLCNPGWIDTVSSCDANFDERHVRKRDEINFPSHGSSSPPPSYGPAAVLSNMDILRDNIDAAPFSNVTSRTDDRPRAYDIGTTSYTTTRCATYAPDVNCNVACSAVPTTICNIASTTCNVASSDLMATLLCNDNGHMTDFRQSENTTVPRSCQSGPIDVEDLAMYFDPCKPSSTAINRTTYSKRPRYGHSTRIDQPRQEDDCRYLDFCNLRPCIALESSDSRSCDVGNTGNLAYCDFNDPRSCYLGSGNVSRFDDPRFRDSGYVDPSRFYDIPFAYNARREMGQNDLGQNDDPKWSSDWLRDNCPELFNFCSEERWLRCPASDRCPLYDTSYAHGASAVLPPCLYENLQAGYSDNWYYDYAEDEQLAEDYLNNEKRKERSRDAARCRRSKETDIFAELAAALPIEQEQAAHLDKASVMRLAIAYLKVRSVVDSTSLTKSESSAEMDELFPKALNGFMLVLSSDGNMVYLSENVSDYLGVSQMDMMGQSVYEYSHPCDHDELRECLSSKPTDKGEKRTCNFFLRLKCTLTNKGRKVNLKSASYKVIHCTGKLTNIRDSNSNSMEVENEEQEKEDELAEQDTGACLVLVGSPIPHPSNIEIPLGRHTFLSKHSLSMKFTYADEKLAEYLGWDSEELMGRSVFEFYHALDNPALDKCFKCLFSKGQCETVAYRFLGKRGGYAWVVTQATLIHCSKQQKPISVVCVNYILSGLEHEDEVYSVRQLAACDSGADFVKSERSLLTPVATGAIKPMSDSCQVLNDDKKISAKELVIDDESRSDDRPLAVTASIFRSANGKDDTRKDDDFSKQTQEKKTSVRILKESINESLKENDEPADRHNCCRPPFAKTPFIFQDKPAVERDSSDSVGRRDRPQAVTKHLFAPLVPTVQQQQQQQQQQEQPQLSCRPPPQTATASIFAPRTEDMNKGFLTFSEDQPGLTMLKDEPEDLTHLAPTAGDVCVPLEDTPFLSDMLDEFIFGNDNYGCPLLSPGDTLTPELRSPDLSESLKETDLVSTTTKNKNTTDRLADSDPFMYGDSPGSPCDIDSSAVSPSLSKYRQSPERSVDSLGSPIEGSGGDGLSEDEMLMLGISDNIGDDELALRAPYIPMSDQDEALELLISDDMVMWGSSQSDKGSSKWLLDDREQRGSESSLAQLLLRTDQAVSRRYNDHGGGLMNPLFGQITKKNTILESTRWSSNQERTDRPNKRIHSGLNLDSESEHKRLKCDDSIFERVNFDSTLLTKQQRASTTSYKKSSQSSFDNTCNSQLLRRLVSPQIPCVVSSHTTSSSNDGSGEHRRGDNSKQRARVLNDVIDLVGTEDDHGGGGGGGNRVGDDLDRMGTTSRNQNPTCGGSSVLMNLLVSGCDDPLMNSRSMPILLSKNLTTPLSINVDNQIIPQCLNADNTISLPDHLSPDTRKHLIGPFTGGGGDGGGTTPIISPTTSAMAFDGFDYDGSAANLLQIGPDLLGGLLDRNLV
ncbi:uncharacterized protein LOC126848222 isoform X2 [Cataglyphis hispanica]|uniref:uncharacterized protein LOC126848222 isoform X2 n=1 Tax=Cataglyphis hispanica TaxID=1086592 RepID=UPI00217FFAAF|nr:uncharacterized protein LOC126848222 isoform X2 [Cataglyphis hispanica]